MKRKIIFYGLALIAILLIGRFLSAEIGGLLGILGLGGIGLKKKREKGKELAGKTDETEKEIEKLREKAEKLKESGEDREEEVKKIEQQIEELKKNDKSRVEKADNLTDKLKNLMIVLLLLPGLIFFVGVLQAEEEIEEEQIQELSINDVSIPEDYEGLLEQHKEVLKIAIEFEKLYREERQDKLEALELAEEMEQNYKEERAEREEIEELFTDLDKRTERLLKIIETHEELFNELLESQGSGVGVYGGVGYSPAYPLHSSIDAGVTIDF